MKIEDLKPAQYNPRAITPESLKGLKASIRTMGDISGICYNKQTKQVFAGHQRIKALTEEYGGNLLVEGPDDAPVLVCPNGNRFPIRVVDWPEDLERLANISANNPHIQGNWTDDVLEVLKQAEKDFVDLGKELRIPDLESDLQDILSRNKHPHTNVPPKIDKADELQKQWGTATGQVWKLGSHRLICGDCTDKSAIARLMKDEKAHLLFTSPPYWVGKEYEVQKSEKEIDVFIEKCVGAWATFVGANFGRVVINTGSAAIHRVEKKRKAEVLPLIDKWQRELRRRGWLLRHIRIWVKHGVILPARVAPKSDVVDQHWEHIATFEPEDWEYLETFWNPAGDQRGQERAHAAWAQQGVWDDLGGDRSAGGTHSAAFPIELPERYLTLYTKIGEIVFDPFMGSGTTLIAAENLGRRSMGVEINPAYVAVTLQRWLESFGIQPEKVEQT